MLNKKFNQSLPNAAFQYDELGFVKWRKKPFVAIQ